MNESKKTIPAANTIPASPVRATPLKYNDIVTWDPINAGKTIYAGGRGRVLATIPAGEPIDPDRYIKWFGALPTPDCLADTLAPVKILRFVIKRRDIGKVVLLPDIIPFNISKVGEFKPKL